jgi:hypothetical protein
LRDSRTRRHSGVRLTSYYLTVGDLFFYFTYVAGSVHDLPQERRGVHRLFLGGESYVACSLATVLAGLLGGMVHRLNKGRLLGPVSAMAFGAGIELLHGGLVLLLVRPFTDAVEIVRTSIPEMLIAVALGVGIGVVIFHDVIKVEGPKIEGPGAPE